MKKLVNDPQSVVRESLEGLVLSQTQTAMLRDRLIVVQTDRVVDAANRGRVPVALLSGGGAGHEPAHAGYVGTGMLTGAVSGDVFSSPSVDAVLDGIRAVTGTAGCLLVVKNYTGDRLNFGLAAELARAEGLLVETVVVADDVAITDSDANAGRRGLAGTVLVHKAAGAAAADDRPLAEVVAVARRVAEAVATIGLGLSAPHVPGSDGAGSEGPVSGLADDEVEIGLGIHGERGVERGPLRPADDLVADLVDRLVADRGLDRGDRVVALVGSAGSTPVMELSIVTRAVAARLATMGIDLVRIWQGLVMTSLDAAGISVTVLPVTGEDDDLVAQLDQPTEAIGWPGARTVGAPRPPRLTFVDVPVGPREDGPAGPPDLGVRSAIDAACRALLAHESELTRLDQIVGDGDLGTALARGARAWVEHAIDGDAPALLRRLSELVRREVGGTSGPLYAAGLLRTAESVADGENWAAAFATGVAAVSDLGGAVVGDRTMVDALEPASRGAADGIDAAVAAARAGADGTAELLARRGRSSYLGEAVRGTPDPGAVAVVVWLTAVRDALGSPPTH